MGVTGNLLDVLTDGTSFTKMAATKSNDYSFTGSSSIRLVAETAFRFWNSLSHLSGINSVKPPQNISSKGLENLSWNFPGLFLGYILCPHLGLANWTKDKDEREGEKPFSLLLFLKKKKVGLNFVIIKHCIRRADAEISSLFSVKETHGLEDANSSGSQALLLLQKRRAVRLWEYIINYFFLRKI